MTVDPSDIKTWLYTSELGVETSETEIKKLVGGFAAKNELVGLTGFMVSNGIAVMQLLEGPSDAVERMKAKIECDARHHKVVTEVWELEESRAYPHWAMRFAAPAQYELMFTAIERFAVRTIAADIAHMLFDETFFV